MTIQKADVYQPIEAARTGPPPLVVNITITPTSEWTEGGMQSSQTKVESYVLLSVLPRDLQERVKVAVQALQAGM